VHYVGLSFTAVLSKDHSALVSGILVQDNINIPEIWEMLVVDKDVVETWPL